MECSDELGLLHALQSHTLYMEEVALRDTNVTLTNLTPIVTCSKVLSFKARA